MKSKSEYKLIWIGVIVSLIIIYLTKIDSTPSKTKWIYELGQSLWFNLAICYLSSVIFYWIVVYIPERRKQKKFLFQMGFDIQMIQYKGWRFFYYLRNAAGMAEEIPDTGKLTVEDLDKFLAKVTPQTVHCFENEPGKLSQTFQSYLLAHRVEMNEAINKALVIPYDDIEAFSLLLYLQRTSILTGNYTDNTEIKFGRTDILAYFAQLQMLDYHVKKYYFPFLLDNVKRKK